MKKLILFITIICLNTDAREVNYLNDSFGYFSTENCSNDYIDLSGNSTALILTAYGAQDANDDGAALLNLQENFKFYNVDYSDVVVSTNGYLAFSNDLSNEGGGDFSNDCLLPSVPDNTPVTLERILPFHDDLEKSLTGELRHTYYANCPRIGGACTIIEWKDWQIRNTTDVFSFQVVLYHNSSQIVFQYSDLGNIDSLSASIGLQNRQTASIFSCNQANTIDTSSSSLCYSHPIIFKNGFE